MKRYALLITLEMQIDNLREYAAIMTLGHELPCGHPYDEEVKVQIKQARDAILAVDSMYMARCEVFDFAQYLPLLKSRSKYPQRRIMKIAEALSGIRSAIVRSVDADPDASMSEKLASDLVDFGMLTLEGKRHVFATTLHEKADTAEHALETNDPTFFSPEHLPRMKHDADILIRQFSEFLNMCGENGNVVAKAVVLPVYGSKATDVRGFTEKMAKVARAMAKHLEEMPSAQSVMN